MKAIFVVFNDLKDVKNFDNNLKFYEYELNYIENFYSDQFYAILLRNYQDIKQKKTILFGLKYPLESLEDRNFIKEFINYSTKTQANYYYFPKPTNKANLNNFALFALQESITLDVFKISILQKQGAISIYQHERLQQTLYKENFKKDSVFKRFYPESKQLFELSPFWQEYQVDDTINTYNLIQRATYFYPAPKGIGIQLNNICNLECTMCWHFSPIYKAMHDEETKKFYASKKELESSIVYGILDYAGKHKCTVHFSAKGEPTIDKRLPDFIAYAKKAGCPVISLVTNATLLDKKLAKKLLDSGLNRIYFSVDGATEETYEKTRGVKLSLVESNICNFLEESKNYNDIRVRFNCTLEGDAINEVDTFIEKWKPYANEIQSLNFTYVNSYTQDGGSLKKQINDACDNARVCNDPWLTDLLIVDPVGNVYPSCGCPVSQKNSAGGGALLMGNVYRNSLEEIWGGIRYKNLRKENLLKEFLEFNPCQGCSSRKLVSSAKEQSNKIDIGVRRMFIFDKDEDR